MDCVLPVACLVPGTWWLAGGGHTIGRPAAAGWPAPSGTPGSPTRGRDVLRNAEDEGATVSNQASCAGYTLACRTVDPPCPSALAVATRDRASSSVLINVRISRRSHAARCLVGGGHTVGHAPAAEPCPLTPGAGGPRGVASSESGSLARDPGAVSNGPRSSTRPRGPRSLAGGMRPVPTVRALQGSD